MAYNLASPNGIVERCDLSNLMNWFERELDQVPIASQKAVLREVASDLNSFVSWSEEAVLLWPECDRIPLYGAKQKYFSYPSHIKALAKTSGVYLDRRANGPAIASFFLAGGERCKRFGSSNSWSIHHLYSGKFPYYEREDTMHAAKQCKHFTQSAGLIAVHPVADAMVDEFPFFAWLLRAQSYVRFGYDPDGAFSSGHDEYGFAPSRPHRVIVAGDTPRS